METVTLAQAADENGLCVMLKEMLQERIYRGGPLLHPRGPLGLSSRLGIDASDAGEQATLIFGGGRCTIESGLEFPDLVLRAGSDLFPRLSELPVVLGVPWLLSGAGARLLLSALRGEVQVRGLLRGMRSPLRTAKATLDLVLLVRMLSGT